MKHATTILTFSILLFACKSVPDKVRANKEKFIQVAKENSRPIDINDLKDIYEQAKSSNVEGKIKYLGVDNLKTVYEHSDADEIKLDSFVIFAKSSYRIVYDFATIARDIATVRQASNLTDFEIVEERLYIGKK